MQFHLIGILRSLWELTLQELYEFTFVVSGVIAWVSRAFLGLNIIISLLEVWLLKDSLLL